MHRVQLARCVAHIAVNRQILVVVFRRDAQKGCAPQTLHWQYVYYWRLICCEAVRGELLFAKGMLPCLPLLLPVRGPGIGNAWNRAPNPLAEPGGLHHVGPSLATFAHGECASYHRVPTPCTVPDALRFVRARARRKAFLRRAAPRATPTIKTLFAGTTEGSRPQRSPQKLGVKKFAKRFNIVRRASSWHSTAS